MFTGIVVGVGTVTNSDSQSLTVELPTGIARPALGASLSVAGVCLTVAARRHRSVRFDLLPATRERTTLGELCSDDQLNLEPSLTAGSELGGHLVTGHVDVVGQVVRQRQVGRSRSDTIRFPRRFARLVAPQGSVTIDGVSLTVVAATATELTVQLTPTTLATTTLGSLTTTDSVNLEFDLIARYVATHVNHRHPGPHEE